MHVRSVDFEISGIVSSTGKPNACTTSCTHVDRGIFGSVRQSAVIRYISAADRELVICWRKVRRRYTDSIEAFEATGHDSSETRKRRKNHHEETKVRT